MQRIPGLSALIDDFDLFVVDLWGVMHHGGEIMPAAQALAQAMVEAGKPPQFLSNAPRRVSVVQKQLLGKGLTPDQAQWVHTSGEEGWHYLLENPEGWEKGLIFEPNTSASEMHSGLPMDFTEQVEEADFALVIGIDYATNDLEPYRPRLEAMAKRNLPLVCVNPDRWVRAGDQLYICAGLVAQTYEEEFGGTSHYFGKPFSQVYQTLALRHGIEDLSRVLAIGDLVETDVKGGSQAGFKSCLIEGGVLATQNKVAHGQSIPDGALEAEFERIGVRPDYVSPLFQP